MKRQPRSAEEPAVPKTSDTAVLLLNMGGPDSPAAVRPFLYNLLSDHFIIEFPLGVLTQGIFALGISTLRAGKIRAKYAQIGGGSPQLPITRLQAAALRESLAARGMPADVFIGMSYWHPFIDETLDRIRAAGYARLVCLSLYPHWCRATGGSVFHMTDAYFAAHPEWRIDRRDVREYPLHPAFIAAWSALTRATVDAAVRESGTPETDLHLLFSAHSIPMYLVDRGDPYVNQIRRSCDAIRERSGFQGTMHLSWQSNVGPRAWMQPYTDAYINELAGRGVDNLIVVPISFVNDHIETAQEIDIEYREQANGAGIRHFFRVPTPNIHPDFIRCMTDLALDAAGRAAGVPA